MKTGQIMVGKHGPQNLGTIGDHMAFNQLNKLLGIEVLLWQICLVMGKSLFPHSRNDSNIFRK